MHFLRWLCSNFDFALYLECKNNTYGPNCTLACGHCHGGENCDPTRGGICEGCSSGWRGPRCDEGAFQSKYYIAENKHTTGILN